MRHVPTILLVLSFPAGVLGYALGVRIIEALALPEPAYGFLVLIAPLFVAGLFMLPLLIPFFDRKAKADLAAYRSQQAMSKDGGDESGGEQP